MKLRHLVLGSIIAALAACSAASQTPVLSNVEVPYAAIQATVQVAGGAYGPGAVAYGAIGTPLVLTGSDLGGSGLVQFIAYKNRVRDTSVTPALATVSLWTPNMLILTVPPGAYSGLITVTVEGKASNGLPFIVTPGTYAGTCPAGPTNSQLQITTASLHNGTAGQTYTATLGATGGTTAYSWSITSGTLPSGLSLSSTGTISGTPSAASGTVDITVQVADSSSPQQTNDAVLSLTIESQTLTSAPGGIYNYTATYDGVGNATSYTDTVMGTWNMTAPGGGSGYDSLNRLMAANATWPDGTPQSFCWQYDNFGNRLQQEASSAAFQSGSGGANTCNVQSGASLATDLASYSTNNQIAGTNARGVTAIPGYDAAGGMTSDGVNYYAYDAEGRVCAVQNSLTGGPTAYGYLYNAEGVRVAKGSITPSSNLSTQPLSCDPTTNGFTLTQTYVLGMGGEELTMLDGNNNWQRTNVYAAGKLLATYDMMGLHFHLTDPLGTRRMQVNGNLATLGQPETDIQSLPFGDQLSSYPDQYAPASADDSTPLHFTGKERDAESGLDYFGARYNSSSMGRFMSPDPLGGDLTNPQSLNRYSYVLNNPLTNTDPTGMYTCTDSSDCSSKKDQALEKSLASLRGSKDADVARAANAYGAQNKDNGVSVGFKDLSSSGKGGDTISTIGVSADGSLRANSAITLNSKDGGTDFTADVGHEGSHAADAQDVVKSGLTEDGQAIHAGMNITPYQSEQRAYGVTNSILNSANESRNYTCGSGGCLLGKGASDIPGTVDRLVGGNAVYNQGGRPMSSTNQGPSVVNGVTPKATVPSVPH